MINLDNVVMVSKKGTDRMVLKLAKKKVTFKLEVGIDECMKIVSTLLKKVDPSKTIRNATIAFDKMEEKVRKM